MIITARQYRHTVGALLFAIFINYYFYTIFLLHHQMGGDYADDGGQSSPSSHHQDTFIGLEQQQRHLMEALTANEQRLRPQGQQHQKSSGRDTSVVVGLSSPSERLQPQQPDDLAIENNNIQNDIIIDTDKFMQQHQKEHGGKSKGGHNKEQKRRHRGVFRNTDKKQQHTVRIGNKLLRRVQPRPDNWQEMDFYDARHHFQCKRYAHRTKKPLPTLEEWIFLKNRYKEIVDSNVVWGDDTVLPTEGYDFDDNGNPPPWHAAHGERGRGLFASRDITMGELVHDGAKSDVYFPNAMSWREFIFSLPRNKACDVIDWCWTQQVLVENGNGGDFVYIIFSSMNISILINGGEDEDTMNVNPKSEYSSQFYALRDIKMGEELLTDYSIYDTVWGKAGLGDDDDNDNYDDEAIEEEEAEEEEAEEEEIEVEREDTKDVAAEQ